MSLIADKTVGVTYEMSVFHLGVAFAFENKHHSGYGYSFRIEQSHKSGAVHTKCVTRGQGNFRHWLEQYTDILTTSVDYQRMGNKRRVINAVLQKIEDAAAKYLLEAKNESDG